MPDQDSIDSHFLDGNAKKNISTYDTKN